MKAITGIYQITNKLNGKVYIGQSINIQQRWKQHRYDARKSNSILARAMRRDGIANFVFDILIECPSHKLNILESKCIEYKNSLAPNGYNAVNKGTVASEVKEERMKAKEIQKKLYDTEYKQAVHNLYASLGTTEEEEAREELLASRKYLRSLGSKESNKRYIGDIRRFRKY